MQAAAENGWRAAMRVYAALAVLRQAALCLAHYGVHCAHAYMSQVLDRAPQPATGIRCGVSPAWPCRQSGDASRWITRMSGPISRVLGSTRQHATISPAA